MTPVALGRSSCHCCSSLVSLLLASWVDIAHWQIHADSAAGTMLVELGQSNRQCWSSARQTSTRNCCSDPTELLACSDVTGTCGAYRRAMVTSKQTHEATTGLLTWRLLLLLLLGLSATIEEATHELTTNASRAAAGM